MNLILCTHPHVKHDKNMIGYNSQIISLNQDGNLNKANVPGNKLLIQKNLLYAIPGQISAEKYI